MDPKPPFPVSIGAEKIQLPKVIPKVLRERFFQVLQITYEHKNVGILYKIWNSIRSGDFDDYFTGESDKEYKQKLIKAVTSPEETVKQFDDQEWSHILRTLITKINFMSEKKRMEMYQKVNRFDISDTK